MTEPTDAELDAVLYKHWPAFSMQATLVRMRLRAAMRAAIVKWGTPPAEQAAHKAAPGEPSDAEIDAFLDSPGGIEWVIADKRERYRLLVRAALAKWAAPQQEAQEPVAYAIFAENGNIRLWSTESQHVKRIASEQGLKLVKLYTAPQPAPAPLSEREAFERDWEKRHAPAPINGRTRDDGRYGDSSIQDAWESWQARAALAAQKDTP